ncbi:hypothetical protein TGAM01_v202792 [Trichoderma gamsii]|uniref:Nephrocystin 3-like N-terminal domain-containing protein n=1 Tax=Trichoderma gamsii TaxID=398673 RepID=A0A2P4ZVK1_9HYPO|nr:hypothetical protein TGAM01_v202792 [Trichoderma gamsii]PON28298.1 hypothetical protein TGAM01_v202792 [Trichoderma gamsii]
MADSRTFSQNALGDNAKVFLGDNHVTVNATGPDADKLFLRQISQTDPIYDKKDILMRKGPLLRIRVAGYSTTKTSGNGKTMLVCGIIEEFEEFEEFEKLEVIKRFLESKFEKLEKSSKLEEFEKFSKYEKLERLEEFKKFKQFKESKEFAVLDAVFSSTNVAYYFCQAADHRANSATAVIRGLIFSALKSRPVLLKRIRERYGDGPKGQLDGDKALVVLCDNFETIVRDRNLTNCIYVIDALGHYVKWLVSSRSEKFIKRKLAKISQTLDLEVEENTRQVSASVDIYINHQVQEITAIADDEVLQSRTSNILKNKASGTFLWAALVVEQLRDTDHWQVEDVLKEMLEGLGRFYDLILNQMDKLKAKAREACQALLSIVAAAMRPLHLTELLVFINANWKDSVRFKTSYQLRDRRDLDVGEDDLSRYPIEITDYKDNTGADTELGTDFFAYSNHFMSVPRENVMEDRRTGSAFHYMTLDLSQGPYQGLDLRAGSASIQHMKDRGGSTTFNYVCLDLSQDP